MSLKQKKMVQSNIMISVSAINSILNESLKINNLRLFTEKTPRDKYNLPKSLGKKSMPLGVVYLITYIPFLKNDEFPCYYIGSTSKDLEKYFGSVNSKLYKNWWKKETENNPQNFKKEILYERKQPEDYDLLEMESYFQRLVKAPTNSRYFNKSYANCNGPHGNISFGKFNGNYGTKRSVEWKYNHSILMKEKLNTSDSKIKRSKVQKISQNRKEVSLKKSLKQKERWRDPLSNLHNSSKLLKKEITFKDRKFESLKDFIDYTKSIKLSRNKLFSIYQLQDWNFTEYRDFINLIKCVPINLIKLNLSKIISILEFSIKENSMTTYGTQNFLNIRKICEKFDIDYNKSYIIRKLYSGDLDTRLKTLKYYNDVINKSNNIKQKLETCYEINF